MGKKTVRKFIDKSKATTFTLTRKYVDSDEEEGHNQQQQHNKENGLQFGEQDMDPELADLLGMTRYAHACLYVRVLVCTC
jgi:hypothetical protein